MQTIESNAGCQQARTIHINVSDRAHALLLTVQRQLATKDWRPTMDELLAFMVRRA